MLLNFCFCPVNLFYYRGFSAKNLEGEKENYFSSPTVGTAKSYCKGAPLPINSPLKSPQVFLFRFSSFSYINRLVGPLAQVRNSVGGCHFFLSLIKQDRDVSIAMFPEDSTDSAVENQLLAVETRDRKLSHILAISQEKGKNNAD